jgi:MFS family permease
VLVARFMSWCKNAAQQGIGAGERRSGARGSMPKTLGRSMSGVEDLGRALRMIAWTCAGCLVGGVLGAVVFAGIDLKFRLVPNEPPFQWVEPMFWTSTASAVVGAGLAAFLVARRFRKQTKQE